MATIAEVGRIFDLTPDTLRYYERVGLIPQVHRNANGIRNYDEGDLQWVEFIKCMRNSGLSIEALVSYVEMFQEGTSTHEARKQLLIEEREKLQERMNLMQATLERLDAKIERYETSLIEAEDELKKTMRRKTIS